MMLLVTLSACSSPLRRLPELSAQAETAYVLGPGDVLQVTVYDQPELTGSYHVSDGGTLAIPLLGVVPAQGLTLQQLQHDLQQQLQAKVVKSPDVTVQVTEYRPFFILGEVKNPGSYAYVPDMTVLTAVALAGGFTFRASQAEVSITRRTAAQAHEARAQRAARVLPGDTIYVFERHF